MSLLNRILTAAQGDQLVSEVARIATAFERIATAVEKSLALPEPPTAPERKLDASDITEYGKELSEEDIDNMREKLRESGLSDRQIEDQLLRSMFSEDEDR